MAAVHDRLSHHSLAPFLAPIVGRRRAVLLVLALVLVGGVSAAAYWGSANYPDYSQVEGAKAEQRITSVYGMPLDADARLVGDLLVERFYAVDPATGTRFVADMCKGRVTDLLTTKRSDSTMTYAVALDRRGLTLDAVKAIVGKTMPTEPGWTYLGVQMQGGESEIFSVNYSGRLARSRAKFRGPHGEDTTRFLRKLKSTDIGTGARVYTNKDNNDVLSSTLLYPYFTTLFGLKDAVFLSRLIFADATSNAALMTPTR